MKCRRAHLALKEMENAELQGAFLPMARNAAADPTNLAGMFPMHKQLVTNGSPASSTTQSRKTRTPTVKFALRIRTIEDPASFGGCMRGMFLKKCDYLYVDWMDS